MFVKGKSGNPAGRKKKGDTAREAAVAALKRAGLTEIEHAENVRNLCQAGDSTVIKMVSEYMWGKPIQRTENETDHYFPENITIEIVRAKNEEGVQA